MGLLAVHGIGVHVVLHAVLGQRRLMGRHFRPGPVAIPIAVHLMPAFKSGDADAVAACYADDAIMWFPGGPMAKGRAAIREGFAGYFANSTILDVSLTPLGQERMGPAMASWGTYAIRAADKATGAESTETGRYTDVSKQIGGRWLYVVDHPSDDPPAAPQAPGAGS